jgi:hypothetical protein
MTDYGHRAKHVLADHIRAAIPHSSQWGTR